MSAGGLRRAGFVVVATAAGLLALEGLGRALLPEPIPDLRGDTRGNRFPYDPDVHIVSEASDGTRRLDGGGTFHAQTWSMPATNYRIAVVGDSTVHGPFTTYFDKGLEMGAPHETLNFGVYALASDRVRILAGAALEQDLDLLVVYVGHNEYLDARLNPRSLWSFDARRRLALLTRGGVARMIAAARPAPVGASTPGGPSPKEFGVVEAEEAAQVEASYAGNLAAICADAKAAGVPVAFVAPISSLVHAPEHKPGGPGYAQDELLKRLRARAAQDPATDLSDEGVPLDDAAAAWLEGIRALGRGERDAAVAALRRARLLDAHPWRVAEPLMAVAERVSSECGATFVTPEADFLADPRYLDLADPLFVDQVHPSAQGVRVLAAAVVRGLPLPTVSTWRDPGDVAPDPATQPDAVRGYRARP